MHSINEVRDNPVSYRRESAVCGGWFALDAGVFRRLRMMRPTERTRGETTFAGGIRPYVDTHGTGPCPWVLSRSFTWTGMVSDAGCCRIPHWGDDVAHGCCCRTPPVSATWRRPCRRRCLSVVAGPRPGRRRGAAPVYRCWSRTRAGTEPRPAFGGDPVSGRRRCGATMFDAGFSTVSATLSDRCCRTPTWTGMVSDAGCCRTPTGAGTGPRPWVWCPIINRGGTEPAPLSTFMIICRFGWGCG